MTGEKVARWVTTVAGILGYAGAFIWFGWQLAVVLFMVSFSVLAQASLNAGRAS